LGSTQTAVLNNAHLDHLAHVMGATILMAGLIVLQRERQSIQSTSEWCDMRAVGSEATGRSARLLRS
jgi:hypothetical protein